jgi:2-polyprenyl-6-methoxyphenol hydroxylase-like FAD-dependent oxidoreductase
MRLLEYEACGDTKTRIVMINVLISGAGIAGLTLALCLRRLGVQPTVVERSSHLRDAGYMIDFFGPGYDVAERLNLLPQLACIHYQIPWLRFVDAPGRTTVAVEYATFRKLLNNRHFNFMRGELEALLYSMGRDHIDVRFGATVASFHQDGERVHVTFNDGTKETFDLLVGADGVHSSIRRMAFGNDERFARQLGYQTAAYILDGHMDLQAPRDAFTTLNVPHCQVAIYPIRDNRLATFFVHRVVSTSAGLPSSPRTELERVYGDLDWIVPKILQYMPNDEGIYYDSVEQIEMPTWTTGHVTLVGDACQAVSLVAGQGASMAMAGAYVLAGELAATPVDLPGACTRYERRVKPDILKKQQAGRNLAGWFIPDTRLRLDVRNTLLRLARWQPAEPLFKRTFGTSSVLKL